ncbi:MAG: hypothetical protein E7600_01170 [Ruminococcaceae bacterium]|nr:hypothetical protein [Oscillospiraceae bacterium]
MNNEYTVENASQQPKEGDNNTQQEKTFTQSQLEEIIRERLLRERKVNESLSSVKQLLKSACEKGYIKGASYTEMAKDLVGKLQEKQQAECDEEPEKDTTSVCADTDGKETDGDNAGNDVVKEDADNKQGFMDTLSRIKAKYPKSAVEKLLEGNLFETFARGRSGSAEEIFDDYYTFVSMANPEFKKAQDNTDGTFSSTAFSSQSGVAESGSNLTRQQMDIAKSAGMSYREYQNLLESIPTKNGRAFN